MHGRYANCLVQTLEHDRAYKERNWILVDSVYTLWIHSTKSKRDKVTIQGHHTEKRITIHVEQHPHFQNYLLMFQDT